MAKKFALSPWKITLSYYLKHTDGTSGYLCTPPTFYQNDLAILLIFTAKPVVPTTNETTINPTTGKSYLVIQCIQVLRDLYFNQGSY